MRGKYVYDLKFKSENLILDYSLLANCVLHRKFRAIFHQTFYKDHCSLDK